MIIATLLLTPTPAPAAEEVVAGGEITTDSELPERGMPASNPRVKSILASHPSELLTICVAGCGKPAIVQALPKPIERRSAGMRTTAGGSAAAPHQPAYDAIDRDAVMCVAGCGGRPGQVVQKMPGLPPPRADAASEEGANEPLDVH